MDKYDNLINLPYKKSTRHPHMPIQNRAAQFSPFAAVSGHMEAMAETSRTTEPKIILDEQEIERIERKLFYLKSLHPNYPEITITYFEPDSKKSGGRYITVKSKPVELDNSTGSILLVDGRRIKITEIIKIAFR